MIQLCKVWNNKVVDKIIKTLKISQSDKKDSLKFNFYDNKYEYLKVVETW